MTHPRIPRLIHQIYLRGSLPGVLARNVELLCNRNPNWEHQLYDAHRAREFITRHYHREIWETYRKIDPRYGAARADFLRHLIIYQLGGVYCDIKSSLEVPLDESIRDEDCYLLAQWRNGPGEQNEGFGLHRDLAHVPGGEFVTYFLISEKGHPFSAAVIQRIMANVDAYRPWSAVGRTGVLRTTGPIAYTLAIHPIRRLHRHRFVTEEEVGARPSIGDGYDHCAVFKNHYSRLFIPVVKLSAAGTAMSRFFVLVRRVKNFVSSKLSSVRHGKLGSSAFGI